MPTPFCIPAAALAFGREFVLWGGAATSIVLVGVLYCVLERLRRARARATAALEARDDALRALRAQVDREAELLDAVPVPVFACDPEGRYVHANRALCTMVGLRSDEVIGHTAADLVPERMRRTWQEDDARLIRGEIPRVRAVTRVPHRDGDNVEVLVEKTIVHIGPGGTPLLLGAFMDISSQREIERELERALESAQRASLVKSEFLATVSHELRTPLHGILGLAECLASEDLPDLQTEWVSMIGHAGERLLGMIDDMLLLASLQQGDLALDHGSCSLLDVFDEVVATTRRGAEAKGLRYHVDVADLAPVRVRADGPRLAIALRKIVDNAVKFTHEGEISLEANSRTDAAGCVEVEIRVEDTGIGIAGAKAREIHDAFVQADSSDRRVHEGAGLGLTVAHRIVELMGGRIDFASEPGRGTVFTVTVVFHPAPAPSNPPLQCSAP